MIDSKKIVKNTIFMYFRMILVMGVSLYTSRIVLDKLGVNDYALYNAVFSLIGMLSFLNGTLSISTSRFLTFELGVNNFDRLQKTFSTVVFAHFVLSSIILLLGETIGLWYINNVLVIEPSRAFAAKIVYQISIISTCISILQVPYTSSIIAHEKMGIYAYVGIFEAVGKLIVVYLLSITHADKLIVYALMIMAIQAFIALIYVFVSRYLFQEVRRLVRPCSEICKSILAFSGWNIVANVSNTLLNEGVILLFNVFFQPFVIAAQSIAKQISSALVSFVSNVRVAVNPQITILYANGSIRESQKLALKSAEMLFYLLLLMGIPCIMVMPKLLDLWLVDVPKYTVEFARLIVLQNILDNFNAAFYTPMTAANKIKKNSAISVLICIIQFVTLYVLFKLGFSPMWAFYVGIFSCVIFSYVVKPYILYKDIGYKLADIYSCVFHCIKVAFIISLMSILCYFILPQDTIIDVILLVITMEIMMLLVIFVLLEKETKITVCNYIKIRLVHHS